MGNVQAGQRIKVRRVTLFHARNQRRRVYFFSLVLLFSLRFCWVLFILAMAKLSLWSSFLAVLLLVSAGMYCGKGKRATGPSRVDEACTVIYKDA